MIIELVKGEAVTVTFPLIDATNSASFLSGATVTATAYYLDSGGAWTALTLTNSPVEIGTTGIYALDLTATETAHDYIILKLTASGAADQAITLKFRTEWPADAKKWAGVATSVGATSGLPVVDAQAISDSTTAADNVEANIGNLDAAVSTRSSHTAADVWVVTTRTITGGTVDSVGSAVDINMDQALPATPTAGSTGEALTKANTNLDATVSSRSMFDPAVDTVTIGTASLADIKTQVDTSLADINLDHLVPVAGTVNDTAPTSSSFVTDLLEDTNDHYNDHVILFTSGALAGQARRISDYDGLNKTVYVSPALTEAPISGDSFVIISAVYLRAVAQEVIDKAGYDLTVTAKQDIANSVRDIDVSDAAALTANTLAENIRKFRHALWNKRRIDKSVTPNVEEYYMDDGLTVSRSFTLNDDATETTRTP